MRIAIFEHGEKINVIEASIDFAERYCAEYGYTFEPEQTACSAEAAAKIAALESENKQLKGKLSAAVESNSMLEECLVEMAGVVYA